MGQRAKPAGNGAVSDLPRGDVNARETVREWPRRVTAEPRPQNRPLGGLTPLLFAAREGCAPCAAELLKAHAEIELADPGASHR